MKPNAKKGPTPRKLRNDVPVDVQRLLHDLETHQIELEMQNEELRQARHDLEESQRKFADLFDFAPVGYFVLDRSGIIRSTNFTGTRMLGLDKYGLIGIAFSTIVVKDDRDLFYEHLRDVFERETKQIQELRVVKEDQSVIHVQLQSVVSDDAEQGAASCRTALIDISERKHMEDELRKAHDELEGRVRDRTAELERRNKELQDFAFIASHDLKEPLRKVQAFGDLLIMKSHDSLTEECLDYLHRMRDASARMGVLLESLLTYSRVTTKGLPFSHVNLAKVVRDALSNLEIRITEANASIKLGDLPPRIEADETQLVQLFQNLLSNALKFHNKDEAPSIRIHSKVANGGRSAARHRMYYQIFVEDKGIGFEEQYLNKIFMPFQRLHGRSEYEGVGIGLAICRKIVERHGGEITAKSVLGKGSTFIVVLPAKQKADSLPGSSFG